jgi:hypothetical protein
VAQSTNAASVMNQGIRRSILRWIHIVFSIPILGYIYSPFEEIPNYAPAVRYVFLPILVLSGLWMWKGHVIRRLISKRSSGASRVAGAESLGKSFGAQPSTPIAAASVITMSHTLELRFGIFGGLRNIPYNWRR